jgi:hypothetical protein
VKFPPYQDIQDREGGCPKRENGSGEELCTRLDSGRYGLFQEQLKECTRSTETIKHENIDLSDTSVFLARICGFIREFPHTYREPGN